MDNIIFYGICAITLILVAMKAEKIISRLISRTRLTQEEEVMLVDLKKILLSLMLEAEQYWSQKTGFHAGVIKKGEVLRKFLLECSPYLKFFNLAYVSDLIDKLCKDELTDLVKEVK